MNAHRLARDAQRIGPRQIVDRQGGALRQHNIDLLHIERAVHGERAGAGGEYESAVIKCDSFIGLPGLKI